MPDPVEGAPDNGNQVQDTPSGKKDEPPHKDPLKEIDQKLSSWIGRLEAQQKKDRETYLAKMEEVMSRAGPGTSQVVTPHADSHFKAMNEKWSERVLQGDIAGVLQEYDTLRRQAEETLSRQAKTQLNKVLEGMEDQPLFKEVKNDVKGIAEQMIGQGYSPLDAAAYALEKSRAAYLMKKHLGTQQNADEQEEDNSASLGMLSGGTPRKEASGGKGKLPPALKAAYERDKAYFKDEKDYLDHLSPQVKKQYGL